jgi:predicted nucleic acid-binding Zn finger protein
MANNEVKTKGKKELSKKTDIQILTDETKLAVNKYLDEDIVSDFSKLPVNIKMTFLQQVPKKFIKEREISGGIKLPYIDHFFAERVLNFISNFNWGSERLASTIEEKKVATKNGEKTMFEATVELKMWIYIGENRIERYIASGHNSYENPATTKADALQSAISKANTKFARQLGLGANVIADESNAYEKIEDYYQDVDQIKKGELPKKRLDDKHFQMFIGMTDDYIEEHRSLLDLTPEQELELKSRMSEGVE